MLGVRADRSADVEHDQFAAQGRPQRGDRRPLDSGQRLELEFRHRHQRAGIAGRYRHIGFTLLDRIDRQPHRGFPAAVTQRLARLVLHPHRDLGVNEPRGGLQRRAGGDERRDHGRIAEEEKFALRVARQCQVRAGDDHGRAVVSPHRVESNADRLRHGNDRGPRSRSDSTRIGSLIQNFCSRMILLQEPASTFRDHAPGPNGRETGPKPRIAVRRPETTAINGHPDPS